MNTLFKTVVGSQAWKMDTPESDIDEFECFVLPSKDILSGKDKPHSNKFIRGDKKDISQHEIGIVIEQLIKGNFNFLIGVMSLIIVEQNNNWLTALRNITSKNISKNCYNSIRGLAIHNYHHYIEKKSSLTEKELQKKRDLIVRTLMFGENILSGHGIEFWGVHNTQHYEIQYWMDGIDNAYKESKLPETPNESEFRKYLYDLRITELNGEL